MQSDANSTPTVLQLAAPEWARLFEQVVCLARRLVAWREQTLTPLGLGDSRLSLLWLCADGRARSQIELCQALGLSPAHVSTLVEQLRRAGWLEGWRPANDRRRQTWCLTDEGRATLTQALAALAPDALAALGQLSSREQIELAAQLESISHWLAGAASASGTSTAATRRGEAA